MRKSVIIQASELDQYYTQPKVAEMCLSQLREVTNKIKALKDFTLLEPSAGTGAFIEAANVIYEGVELKAYDIEPKHSSIVKSDFLKTDLSKLHNVITIGNPPFGKRSKLAIDFFNKAAECSHTIAFIVPIQFQKWSVQSKLDKRFKLIHNVTLDPKSFIFNEKEFSARCCFQIWTVIDIPKFEDLRIKEKPKTSHPDFEIYQYNNTKEARKYFDYDWDFCVPRQGYYDYSRKITNRAECKYNIQYVFFKAKKREVLDILKGIDFEKLSKQNTTIPGFGKADIIQEYERITNLGIDTQGVVA